MSEMNNIDDLFRKGVEQQYPVDEGLWNVVSSQLPVIESHRPMWVFNLNTISLLIVLLGCSFIPKDNSINNYVAILSNDEVPTKFNDNKPEKDNQKIISLLNNKPLNSRNPKTSEFPENQTPAKELNFETTTLSRTTNTPALTSVIQQKIEPKNLINPKQLTQNERLRIPRKLKRDFSLTSNSKVLSKQSIYISKAPNNIEPKRNERSLDIMDPIPFVSYSFNDVSLLTSRVPIIKQEKTRRPKASSLYSIELESLFQFQLSKDISSDNQQLADVKRQGEKSLKQNIIGLNVVKQKKFLIYGAGIQHSTFKEKFNYQIDIEKNRINLSYDTSYQLVSGNFNSNGTPVFLIRQEIEEVQTDEKYIAEDRIVGINTFKRVGVPLFVGFQKTHKNWMAQVRFSAIPQYFYNATGNYVRKDLNSIQSFENSSQIKRFNIANRNDLSLGYGFHEQFAIGIKYSLFQELTSFTTNYDSKVNSQLLGVWLLWKP